MGFRSKSMALPALSVLLSCLSSSAQQVKTAQPSPRRLPTQAAANSYGKLPLTFEANKGQTDPRVSFLSRGNGYSVFLTSKGMVLGLKASSVTTPAASAVTPSAKTISASSAKPAAATTNRSVSFNLVNAAEQPTAVGEKQQPGIANYFIGKDETKWVTHVPTYGQVRYKSVYPGIDLVYYGHDRQVEYDFVVAPKADASQIKFQVTGADQLSIADSGDLVLKVGTGQLEFQAPAIYQEVNGQRTPVAGQYRVQGNQIVFDVASHDTSKALVIDPVLSYSTYLGGRAQDNATAVGVDSAGNAYILGNTSSPDFPLSGGFGTANGGNSDPMFVASFDVSGANLLYADYISGSSSDDPAAMAVAPDGTTYIAGVTSSSDFPMKNAYQSSYGSGGSQGNEAFISELSPDGATLEYSTYLGGSASQYVNGIAISSAGEMMIVGNTYSTDFPTANAYQSTFPATIGNDSYTPQAAFITRLSADGSTLVYSTYFNGANFGGENNCYYGCNLYNDPAGIGVDSSGNAYIVGSTNAYDLPTTDGAYQTSFPVGYGAEAYTQVAYVAKFSPSGTLSYSTYLGPNDSSNNYTETAPQAMSVDANGEVFVFGNTDDGANFPVVAGGVCTTSSSCSSSFVTKLASNGASLVFSTFTPSFSNGGFSIVKPDSAGNVFLLGSTYGSPGTLTNPIETYVANNDGFIAELNPSATTLTFSTTLGGEEGDSPENFAIDSSGNLYVVGDTSSVDFPVNESSYQQTNGGSQNIFLSKIDMNTSAPSVAIAPSLVQFSVLNVGTTAHTKQAILRNMGTEALTIDKITTSGDFSETDTCGSSVPAAGTCTFTISFTPTAPGSRFGTILIQDNAVSSPHFINLSGVGATPVVTLSKSSLTYTSLPLNTTSAAQSVTLTNTGNATLDIDNIAASGDFAETNNCPSSLALGSSCTVQVTFKPTAGGSRTGSLTFTDNAPDSPEAVSLTGSGYVTTTTISSSSLQFGSLAIKSTSAAKAVKVTNTGTNTMTVTAVNVTGDFAQTNNCSSIAPSASCTLNVTFKPASSGALTGTVTLSDNAQGNPHQIALSGTGIAPSLSISPASLTFGTQNAGVSSTQKLTITNSGNAPLTFSSIQVLGDYAQTNNCSSVAVSGTCTVTVTFDPTANGTRAGSIVFTDGAGNSPQTVPLSGTGVAGILAVSPASLSFPSQPIGSASAPQMITLTNVGTAPQPITSLVALGSFTETNTCPAALAAQASCTVSVSFAPATSGAASGAISLNGSTDAIPVTIAGMGSDFSLAATSSTSSEEPGSSAAYTLNIASVGGAFSQAIDLTCTGAPAGSTCSFSPQSVTPGSGTVSVKVSVTTQSSANRGLWIKHGGSGTLALWILHLNGVGLALIVFGTRRGRAFRRMYLALVLPCLIGTTLLTGCGGSSKTTSTGGTPAGTYQLTVVATSGNLQHFTTLTMKVE